MTKRMLSLLLALVMTLSLCVPALAAGEFAEPVTEVEEQAPVAPVALEPEAEAEPVAEPAADEAQTAAIIADEPVAASTINQLREALNDAITKAHEIEADVKAGKYVSRTYTYAEWKDGEPDQGVEDFLDGIEVAVELRNQLQSYAVDEDDVWDAIAAIDTSGLSKDVGEVFAPTIYSQLATVVTDIWEVYQNVEVNKILKASDFQSGWYDKYKALYLKMKDNGLIDTTTGTPTKGQMNYVAALEILNQTIKGDALYSKFVGWQHITSVRAGGSAIYDTANDLPVSNPTETNQKTTLGAAVKATEPDKDRLVAAYTAVQTIVNGGVYNDPDLSTDANAWINGAKALLTTQQPNGLKEYVTKFDVDAFVAKLNWYAENLTPTQRSAKIVSYQIKEDHKTVTVAVEWSKTVPDRADYQLWASYDGGTAVRIERNNDTSNDSNPNRWYYVINCTNLNGSADGFQEKKVLSLKLYTKDTDDTDAYTKEVDSLNITFDFTYIGPDIVKATYNKGTAPKGETFTAVLNSTQETFGNFTISSITVTRPDATTKTVKNFATNKVDKTWSDNPIQVGTYKLVLNVVEKNASDKDAVARPAVEVKVPDITTYVNVKGNKITAATPYGTNGYDSLLKAIAGADGYEKLIANKAKTTLTTAEAQKVVKDNLAAANKIVAAAATTPDTKANDNTVDDALIALTNALALLTTEADQSDLDAAIAEAEALVDTDYTAATWDALKAAVKTGKSVKKSAVTSSVEDAAKIAKAAKDIRSAIAGLAAVKPSKTALQALVDSVPAKLASNNYTAASKAAVNAAVTAANAVLADNAALKSEVAEATEDLTAALNALEVAEAGIQPPVGGTGWTQYNGVWYYFVNNVMKKNYWVTNGSNHNLWYHMGADGALDTGFQYIEDKTFGHGWYMLQGDNSNGMLGAMLTGWQDTKIAGMGWFVPDHNGNYGDCTWTKSWGNYYPIANTWDIGGNHITK